MLQFSAMRELKEGLVTWRQGRLLQIVTPKLRLKGWVGTEIKSLGVSVPNRDNRVSHSGVT